MRITFVLPYLELNGGNLVVAIYASGLAAKGHHVTVVARPLSRPTLVKSLSSIIRNRGLSRSPATIVDQLVNVDVRLVTTTDIANGTALPEADILIATWWETVEWITSVETEKGRKLHFVQGHEVFDYLPQDRARAALLSPMPKLVVSEWLATLMSQEYCAQEVCLIENAVDVDRFHCPPRNKNVAPTFGFVNTNSPVKNVRLAVASLNAFRRESPGIKAISFGAEIGSPGSWIEYYCSPHRDLIPRLYARCDAWLFTSTSEGFGLPILEAMASRTPVIATAAGAAPQLVNNQNGQIVDFSVDSVATAMRRISDMPNREWKILSDNAFRLASNHTWHEAIAKMENILHAYLP